MALELSVAATPKPHRRSLLSKHRNSIRVRSGIIAIPAVIARTLEDGGSLSIGMNAIPDCSSLRLTRLRRGGLRKHSGGKLAPTLGVIRRNSLGIAIATMLTSVTLMLLNGSRRSPTIYIRLILVLIKLLLMPSRGSCEHFIVRATSVTLRSLVRRTSKDRFMSPSQVRRQVLGKDDIGILASLALGLIRGIRGEDSVV